MKRFIRCLVFSGSVLLTIASASQGGEVGRVIGRIIPPSPGVTGPIHVVSLVNDHVRMDGEVEKDGSFLIAFVPPGRYLVVVERGFLVLSELEVVPDLTTSLAIPFNDYYNSALIGSPAYFVELIPVTNKRPLQLGEVVYPKITLRSPPFVYPDKTFSGYVILGEEELRSRKKPLELDTKKFGKMNGYGYTP